jgi:copper chaperone NosL
MRRTLTAVLLALLALSGCKEDVAATMPEPAALTESAIGRYCGMNVLEHTGPKGQVLLDAKAEPIWFSAARDVFAFTFLPEESKTYRALYVSDMSRAESWDSPGATNWVEARKAVFVIGSDMKSGMGADETVPFSERADAEAFVREHGGRVVRFEDVPRDYVLGSGSVADDKAGSVDPEVKH